MNELKNYEDVIRKFVILFKSIEEVDFLGIVSEKYIEMVNDESVKERMKGFDE